MKLLPKQTIYDKLGPILDIVGMGAIFREYFLKKGVLFAYTP